ncbi:glutamate synthase [Streptomyces sp. CA-210063]|uniref:GltB/FmdC/FwdC-like GXGXG domain-containing protein n=1 Tax=Streptomyces sp. CA-210063 TaxID=2801029 RepID=UPI00214BA7B7|nr:glutamate synthase [Streptomyces sp. CA-210063]UUU35576.1 glutamate synthase [Streptomyces sp. CA-210063]
MAALTTTLVDLAEKSVRDLNSALHQASSGTSWHVAHPDGAHNLAVGLTAELDVVIDGPAGYYCAGMNQRATVTVHGNAGTGVAENMMSGTVRVRGSASQSAGATAHGGLLVIEGNASARCGISMKGVDIVVGGDVGHMSAFMGQAGRLVVCGDAGDALGDSLYEARVYVQGRVKSLGADCVEKEMRAEHLAELAELLKSADRDDDPAAFRRYGSARKLYHFEVDNSAAY